jgi:hypothetical protein
MLGGMRSARGGGGGGGGVGLGPYASRGIGVPVVWYKTVWRSALDGDTTAGATM